jgi:uroporphyrinogen-III synthase/GrpB-like predicted nucleotidyltransferase (UPF0157 family)
VRPGEAAAGAAASAAGAGASEAGGSAARPLAGRTVVVTRPAAQSAGLADLLTAAGAEVIAAPAIEIVAAPLGGELRAAIAGLHTYDVVIFTSVNGVEIFFDRCAECGAPPPTGDHPEVVAIGPATAAALEERGVATSLVPDEYVAEGVLAAVEARLEKLAGKRVLIPRAREARAVLPDTLRERGAHVDVVTVYETRGARELPVPAAVIEAADYVTFTSSSTVKHFAALLGEAGLAERLAGVRLASIGPVTSETLREHGLAPAVEAAAYTASGLAAAIVADAVVRAAAPSRDDLRRSAGLEIFGPVGPTVIRLVDHDPGWARRFAREADGIHAALGGRERRIEHIGSTSVPGLPAKPVIDILLVVDDSGDEAAYVPALEGAGYALRVREPGFHEHRLLRSAARDVHVHVFSPDSPEIERYLVFRDRLRTRADERELYGQTKKLLAAKTWPTMDDYADAKTDVVEAIIARGMAERKDGSSDAV